MSVFMDLLDTVNHGKKVCINLTEKTIKVNKKEINLKDSELIGSNDMNAINITAIEPWGIVEELYAKYKRSVPRGRSQMNKSYFYADSVEDLTDNEIAFNMARDFAQACLEGFILLAGLSGLLEWQNENHWFWQSTKDKQLIILKEWI